MVKEEKRSPFDQSRYAFIAVIVLTVTCVVLLVVNHKLQKQNIILAAQFRSLSDAEGPPVGSKIPSLHGTSISGQGMTLNLAQHASGMLLLVLSPTCPHCKANFHNWRDLMPLLPANQVAWVDLTDTSDALYLASAAIPADALVIHLDPKDRSLYNLVATPTTIWLGPGGLVKHVWAGELSDDQISQIRETLRSPNS
jgi:hypothetical protein